MQSDHHVWLTRLLASYAEFRKPTANKYTQTVIDLNHYSLWADTFPHCEPNQFQIMKLHTITLQPQLAWWIMPFTYAPTLPRYHEEALGKIHNLDSDNNYLHLSITVAEGKHKIRGSKQNHMCWETSGWISRKTWTSFHARVPTRPPDISTGHHHMHGHRKSRQAGKNQSEL